MPDDPFAWRRIGSLVPKLTPQECADYFQTRRLRCNLTGTCSSRITNEPFFAEINVKVTGYVRTIREVAPHMAAMAKAFGRG